MWDNPRKNILYGAEIHYTFTSSENFLQKRSNLKEVADTVGALLGLIGFLHHVHVHWLPVCFSTPMASCEFARLPSGCWNVLCSVPKTGKNALGLIPHIPAIALNQRPTCKCILILRVLAPSWGQLWATISTVFKMFPWAWTGPSLWASLHGLLPFPDPFSMTSTIFFWEHFLISNIHRNPHAAVCFWETRKSTFVLFGVRVSI